MHDRDVRARRLAGVIAGLLAVTAAALVPVAAHGADKPTPTVAQLYKGAKKEQSLTWYSSAPPTQMEATVKAFKKQYPGVDVKIARLASGPLETRYSQERTSGASTADVITNAADPVFDNAARKKKWMVSPLNLPALAQYPAKWVNKSGGVTVGLLQLIIAYNKNNVPGQYLKHWRDVLRPEFKKQIIFGDPRASVTFLALAQLWRDTYGDDFLRKFAAQQPQPVPSIVPAAGTLAAGGAKLVVPGSYIAFQPTVQQGAPIGMIQMSPTFLTQYVTTISTASKKPNAARLFVNFLLTRTGQAAFNSGGGTSPTGLDLPDTHPIPRKYVLDVDIIGKAQKNQASTLSLLGLQ